MPTPHSPPDPDVIDRYFAGTLDAEAHARVEAYCAAHPRYAAALEAVRAVVARADLTPPTDAATALAELRALAAFDGAATTGRRPRSPSVSSKSRPAARWYTVPIVAAVVCAAGVLIVRANRGALVPATGSTRSYHTGTGQRATIHLADGSRVILAPRTTLTVSEPFGRGARDVSLVGEAMFEVTPDRDAAFVVRTGSVSTRVLGTTFDVRRYDEPETHVTVLQGKVSAGAPGHSVTLTAGMAGRFSDSVVATTQSVFTDGAAAWVNGQLVFTDTPVPTILTALSRWYGYAFQLDDSTLATRHATAVFNVADRAETLRLLQGLLRVTMTVRDSTVILRPLSDTRSVAPRRNDRTPITSNTEVGR